MAKSNLNFITPEAMLLLEQAGFVFLHKHQSDSFANEIHTYKSNSFKIRIVVDKGFQSIDIAQLSESEWYSLDSILGFINKSVPSATPCSLSDLIRNVDKISRTMKYQANSIEFINFQNQWRNTLLTNLFSS